VATRSLVLLLLVDFSLDHLLLTIIMANLPPPDHAADFPDDEPVNPESAPMIHHHAPALPKGYIDDNDMEDDEEDPGEDLEEETIKQDDDEEVEEDREGDEDDKEMEVDEEDEDDGVDDNEDEAEFGHNFYVGEGSSAGALLAGNSEVNALGSIACNLERVRRVATRLDKKMFDRYMTEKKMAKKFKEDEFRMNGHEYDITALDATETQVRERILAELRFVEEPPIYTASAPRANDLYIMVRDADMAAREDDDDDITTPRDPRPFEPHGSPHDSQIKPPKGMSVATIQKLVMDKVAEALAVDCAARNDPNVVEGSGGNGGQGGAPPVQECLFVGFMKCGPTQFHGNEGAVELCRWFEKTKSVFGISECTEKSKRLENELRSLKLRDTNIAAYTQRFNELALLCPKGVPTKKKKVELYIKGLLENIKVETTSSKPTVLNEAVRMANTLMEQKVQDKSERIAESNKRKWKATTIKLVVALVIATTTTAITTEAITVITIVTTNIIT
nr:hypothetical protein [Tanacetum cinerariifolium]